MHGGMEEDPNISGGWQMWGAQKGAALEAGKPTGNSMKQSRSDLREWGFGAVLERGGDLPARRVKGTESESPACITGWEVVPSTKRRNIEQKGSDGH